MRTHPDPRPARPDDFAALALSADDLLPTDIQLVMAYRNAIPPEQCSAALERGLWSFPHLTGRMIDEPDMGFGRIVPGEGGFVLEVRHSPAALDIRDLEAMPLEEHSAAFIPQGREPSTPGSLFQARLTLMPSAELSVLGLRVSHAVVDGTGLAWFFSHCTAHLRGVEPPAVFHERRYGFGVCVDDPEDPPHGYRHAGTHAAQSLWDGDTAARSSPVVFAIQSDVVRRHFNAASILDARLRLGAWLCAGVAVLQQEFSEVGLWCDPRGMNGIPASYTGNAGCYIHFPLRDRTVDELTRLLKSMTTRSGFQRIADTYRRIKSAEAQGRALVWDGAAKGMLQLNLVPHAVGGTDFGAGVPAFAILLSRNSSGLRISVTPDASRFLVEACLPPPMGDDLIGKCRVAGLRPSVWCRGRQVLEKQCQ